VTVAGRPARIERRAGTDARPILRLEGHGSREAADALRGEPLLVPASALPELGEDEWWAHELEGCRVTDGEREIGVVRRMRALPSCEVLEVDRTGGGELLVPLVSDAVRDVDVPGRRIDVDMAFIEPEG
jgi:16S rRNA processing protein RimM